MFWITFLLTLLITAIAFVGIAVKMLVKKDGKFERHCENEGSAHCLCGGKGGEACQRCPNKGKNEFKA